MSADNKRLQRDNNFKDGFDWSCWHYARLQDCRRHLDLCALVHQHPRVGLSLVGRTRHNQHTKQQVSAYLGNPGRIGPVLDLRARLALLHGRLCIPHPLHPRQPSLAVWLTYAEAQNITGRALRSLYRWRHHQARPDAAAWRLLEWACHGVCALPLVCRQTPNKKPA